MRAGRSPRPLVRWETLAKDAIPASLWLLYRETLYAYRPLSASAMLLRSESGEAAWTILPCLLKSSRRLRTSG